MIKRKNKNSTKRKLKNKNKKIGILLCIFIILTVVPLLWSLIKAILSLGETGLGKLGVLTPFLLIPYLILLWSIYGIIKLYQYFIKTYKKNQKLGVISLIILTVFIVGIIISYFDVRTRISSVVDGNQDFLVNDGNVYYISDRYVSFTYDKNEYLNVVNLDGSKNKNLCRNVNIYRFSPKFIKNDDIYYYDSIKESFNKINILSCEKSEVMQEYEFIRTDKDNKYAYFVSKDIVEDGKEAFNIYVKYDIEANKVVKEINSSSNDFFIDYDNFDIYYVKFMNDKKHIYKNDKLIYSFENENVRLLAMSDKSLLLYDNNNLYKFDISKNNVVDKVKYKVEGHRILSDMSGKYFHVNDKIYMYNDNVRDLEVIIDEDTEGLYRVEDFGDIVIFKNYNNSNLIIYNKDNKTSETYKRAKYSYDYKNSKLYVTSDKKIIEVK